MTAPASLRELTVLLERTPRLLSELLVGLPESWLDTPDTPGGWTAEDVVGHLISAELADWIPRVEHLQEHGTGRPFETFDRFAHQERDRSSDLPTLLERLGSLRADSLARIQVLVRDEADLDARGLHPELGEVTLRQHLSTWAVHDLDHIAQVFSALAGSRDADVGPWKAYLGILLRRDG